MGKQSFESFIQNQVSRDMGDSFLDESLQETYQQEIEQAIQLLQDIKETSNDEVNNYNIILFGPAGAGKSSFIKTLFSAYTQDMQNTKNQPKDLIIQNLNQNEGTKKYTEFCLKKGSLFQLKSQGQNHSMKQIGINIYDTRGQIRLNKNEQAVIDNLVQGNIKPGYEVTNRKERYVYLLWEFWKNSEQLFPDNILNDQKGINSQPHCIVFVFDGSQDEVPNSEEEVEFYKDIIQNVRKKGFQQPFVIITKIDLFEKKITKKLQQQGVDKQKIKDVIRQQKVQLIENISEKFEIKIQNIDFIENYNQNIYERQITIDYYCLMSLCRMVRECQNHIEQKQKKKGLFCKIFQLIKNKLLNLDCKMFLLKIFVLYQKVQFCYSQDLFLIQDVFFLLVSLKMVKHHYQYYCYINPDFLYCFQVLFLSIF